jgi:hypothetical protein
VITPDASVIVAAAATRDERLAAPWLEPVATPASELALLGAPRVRLRPDAATPDWLARLATPATAPATWIAELAAHTGIALASPAITALAGDVVARCHRVLAAAGCTAEAIARPPVVARLLAEIETDARRHLVLLFRRLVDDAGVLGGTSLRVTAAAAMPRLLPGDPPPVMLELDGRAPLIYRPRSVAPEAWWQELLARAVAHGAPELLVRPLVVRDGYGWDSFLASRPCESRDEVEQFFVRAGLLLRLAQAVGLTDLHARNLIAVGGHPVVIDAETILQPPRVEPDRVTVEDIGLLPAWWGDVPVGGLSPGGPGLTTAFGTEPSFAATWPSHAGTAIDPADHVDAILDGYRRGDALIDQVGDALIPPPPDETRVLVRGGLAYAEIAAASLAPALQHDGRVRELALLSLLADARIDDAMIAGERRALLRLQAPRLRGPSHAPLRGRRDRAARQADEAAIVDAFTRARR